MSKCCGTCARSCTNNVDGVTPLEKFETAEIVEELKRRGFRCIIWMEV